MTTDINVYAVLFIDLVVINSCNVSMCKIIYGPLPFMVVFVFNQFYKGFAILAIGVFNVSAFLQFTIITNHR